MIQYVCFALKGVFLRVLGAMNWAKYVLGPSLRLFRTHGILGVLTTIYVSWI